MMCSKCGYLLSAMDLDCPRCARAHKDREREQNVTDQVEPSSTGAINSMQGQQIGNADLFNATWIGRIRFNKFQKISIWVGVAILLLMCIFPPTYNLVNNGGGFGYGFGSDSTHESATDYSYEISYKFILNLTGPIDIGKLIIQLVILVIIIAVAILLLRTKFDNTSRN